MIKVNESDNSIEGYITYFMNNYVHTNKEFKEYALTVIGWNHSTDYFCELISENYPQYLPILEIIMLLK